MKLIIFLLLLLILTSCNNNTDSSSVVRTCNPFTLNVNMLEIAYAGTTVTTSGNCGEEYGISLEGDYTDGSSITGWRLLNGVLSTNAGNINFTSGGRFMDNNSTVNEGYYVTYGGIDHTVCQNALGVDGTFDLFEMIVTAEFDTDCNVQLRGTFRDYSQCVGGDKITICSGTIILN